MKILGKTFGTAVIAGATAILVGLAPAASAQEHWGHGGGGQFKLLLKAANLSASQKAQVHQIMKSGWQQSKSERAQIQALRGQIADKLAGTAPVTVADVTALQQQIAQVHAQMSQQWAERAIQVRALLTAEQLRRVAQVHEQLKSLRAQMRAVVSGASGEESQVEPASGSGEGLGAGFGEGMDEALEAAPGER